MTLAVLKILSTMNSARVMETKMRLMMECQATVNPIVQDKYVTVKLEYQWLEVTVIATFQA